LDVIFETRLTHELLMKNVLERILECRVPGNCILRVNCPQENYSGRVLLTDSFYIVAGLMNDSSFEGYEAVRRMLSAAEGHVTYLKVAPQEQTGLVPHLHIPLPRVISILFNLPDDPSELYDEKGLLDKVFASTIALQIMERTPELTVPPNEESPANKPRQSHPRIASMNADDAWNMLAPLSDGTAPPEEPVAERPKQSFVDLDVESIRQKAREADMATVVVRPTKRSFMRISPPIVVGFLFILFSVQVMAIIYWPKISSYLQKAASHSAARGVELKAHDRHR
jgi:hypothetical protein